VEVTAQSGWTARSARLPPITSTATPERGRADRPGPAAQRGDRRRPDRNLAPAPQDLEAQVAQHVPGRRIGLGAAIGQGS
jgi:hypothetical protein